MIDKISKSKIYEAIVKLDIVVNSALEIGIKHLYLNEEEKGILKIFSKAKVILEPNKIMMNTPFENELDINEELSKLLEAYQKNNINDLTFDIFLSKYLSYPENKSDIIIGGTLVLITEGYGKALFSIDNIEDKNVNSFKEKLRKVISGVNSINGIISEMKDEGYQIKYIDHY